MRVHFEKYLVHDSLRTVKMSSPTCPECGKVFSRYDVLQRHRRTKHPVKIIVMMMPRILMMKVLKIIIHRK